MFVGRFFECDVPGGSFSPWTRLRRSSRNQRGSWTTITDAQKMASLASAATTTTSYGELSLSAIENLRNTVTALTTVATGQPLNLSEARRLLLDTYFQNLLDPLACLPGNQTPSGDINSLLQGDFVPLRRL